MQTHHFVMVKSLCTDGEPINRVFSEINELCGNNLPMYNQLEGGSGGIRYVFCICADVDYSTIFAREGYSIEKVVDVENVYNEKCTSCYEVFYSHGSFLLWRQK